MTDLQVETENAGRYDDVDADRLEAIVETLGDSNTYVILERPGVEGYAQAATARNPDGSARPGFVVEYRDGPNSHYQADAPDRATVLEILAGWAFDHPDWKRLVQWRVLDLGF